jgi:hypothetical protein
MWAPVCCVQLLGALHQAAHACPAAHPACLLPHTLPVCLPPRTSKSLDKDTSLEEYVERMKEGQKDIYFVSGATMEEVQNSPFVEKLLKKDYEVGSGCCLPGAGAGRCVPCACPVCCLWPLKPLGGCCSAAPGDAHICMWMQAVLHSSSLPAARHTRLYSMHLVAPQHFLWRFLAHACHSLPPPLLPAGHLLH